MLSTDLVGTMLAKHRAGIAPAIRDKARLHIIDSLAISVAAARGSPVADMVLQSMCYGEASGACRVIGNKKRLPPTFAAMVNSALSHTMDFDDIHDIARIHPTSVTLPAALAAAGLGNASGATIIDAVILGNELMCRLGMMLKALGTGPGADWFLSQLFGYLGGTLAAGLVLGLTDEQQVAAQGLAYMQMAGGKEAAFGVGANSRSIYTGFAAQGGVQAALLAKAGMVGPDSSLDGKAGALPLYVSTQPSDAQRAELLNPEGWVWTAAGIKPWPCCRSSHAYVSVALELSKKVRADQIEHITVHVNASGARLCRPLEHRRKPQTLPDAKYSIPYVTAFALLKGRVDLLTLNEETLNDAAVMALAQRVDFEESIIETHGPAPARIDLLLKDGSKLSAKLTGGLMLSDEEVKQKFASCLEYVGMGARVDTVWKLLQNLDACKVDEIFDALEPA